MGWRLWVSDDGSTDATRAILRGFQRRHPDREIRILEGPCRGSAANFLSLLCHSDLPPGPVALCDQDDVWLKGKLGRALRRLEAAGDALPAIYAAESLLVTESLRPIARSSARGALPGFANALVQNLCSGHTTVLNAAAVDLVRRAGPQPGIRHHDWWLYQLVTGAGGPCLLDPAPVALYRQHGGNAVGAASGLRARWRRARAILVGDYARWLRAHRSALRRVSPLLAPEARQLLDRLSEDAPQRGLARAARFRQLRLRRAARLGTLALWCAAALGRA